MDDKLRIVDFHQMTGFNNGFQVAVKQLRFKGIVRVRFVAQAADVIGPMIGTSEQRDNLIHGVYAQTIKRAVLRQSRLGFCFRTVVIEMAFNLNNLAELAALNGFFRGEEAGVKTAILIRRNGQSFASRQFEQLFCLRKRRREGFLNQHIFTRFQRAFSIFKMAVSMGTDDHQFHLRIV